MQQWWQSAGGRGRTLLFGRVRSWWLAVFWCSAAGGGVRSSGGSAVLVDEPTETVDPLDSVEDA